jgi:hypothetical protein
MRHRGLKGHMFVTIYRSTGDQDRHGDQSEESSHQIGPGMIAPAPGIKSTGDVTGYPIDAKISSPVMYFKGELVPDVQQGDEAEFPNGSRYRVVAFVPWEWDGSGKTTGTEVRFAGVVQ